MKKPGLYKFLKIFSFISTLVLGISTIFILIGRSIPDTYVPGIRIAMYVVTFAMFISNAVFSMLVYSHNRTVSLANDDANRRGELFRNLQFSSSNYSIVGFMDRMLIYCESERYIERFINRKSSEFHMVESGIDINDVYQNPKNYGFYSLKIPFREIEGKMVSRISFDKLKFERDLANFEFYNPNDRTESNAYILYNEHTKRRNVIINLITRKESNFFDPLKTNDFTKIKIALRIRSLLGVEVRGVSELFFTNPEQIEGDGSNTYKINSSNFVLKQMPYITDFLDQYMII